MILVLFLIYALFCILVAYAGRNVSVGFGGVLVMCLLFTPLVTALLILIFRKPKSDKKVVYRYKISDLGDLENLDLK